jgi:hypothetical protein
MVVVVLKLFGSLVLVTDGHVARQEGIAVVVDPVKHLKSF